MNVCQHQDGKKCKVDKSIKQRGDPFNDIRIMPAGSWFRASSFFSSVHLHTVGGQSTYGEHIEEACSE